MYTSVLLVALLGPAAAEDNGAAEAPKFQPSYSQAREEGREQSKPLAVIIGTGPTGWQKISDAGLSAQVRKVLAEKYICVYADISRPEGRRLAQALEIGNGSGLVLSTGDGETQAFWHDGTLSGEELERQLRRHGDGKAVARTETLGQGRISYSFDPAQAASSAAGRILTAPSSVAPYVISGYSVVPGYHGHVRYHGHVHFGGYGGGCGGRCR